MAFLAGWVGGRVVGLAQPRMGMGTDPVRWDSSNRGDGGV